MKKDSYPQDLFRRPDTDTTYRTLFCAVCVNIIDVTFLSERSAIVFANLTSNCPLTDKQFSYLKAIKLEHDMRKRSDAIAQGKHKLQFNGHIAKLDTVYNKIGR